MLLNLLYIFKASNKLHSFQRKLLQMLIQLRKQLNMSEIKLKFLKIVLKTIEEVVMSWS